MDIRHLAYFSEVAKHLSFSKAAAALYVSQPSISKAIKSLEVDLGVPLFYRSTKQLELTDAGRAVLTNAKYVLESFHNLTSELHDVMEIKKGEIRIGIPPIVGAAFYSKLIIQFKEMYPDIDIRLTEVGTKMIKQGIDEGSLDVGLVCSYPLQNDGFEAMKLLKDPLMLVVHKDNRLAALPYIRISEIVGEPLILYRKDFSLHDRILEEYAKQGFSPKIVCESSQKDFLIELVEAKLGVTFLPSKICSELAHPAVVARPLHDADISLELGLIWKSGKYTPFCVRKFLEMTQQMLLQPGTGE
ncbi:LysR family transcriptional regulator [Brevibacillus choshinensis]|uniref:LysR family transcriptional regulator n=1 Tax=Brevibacillus choshinensis TaxID=54911 RepID=A0ABX7FVL2_BRECH|nr:LysR family transcriptional regulator [Brevibacillus choshinensis]QRG70291.1 LysR family transcriptional regulator [Brevibacillus choshinensis]